MNVITVTVNSTYKVKKNDNVFKHFQLDRIFFECSMSIKNFRLEIDLLFVSEYLVQKILKSRTLRLLRKKKLHIIREITV